MEVIAGKRVGCDTHLLYHRAIDPPNLSNPPKSLCKQQKRKREKRKEKRHASHDPKKKLKYEKEQQKGSLLHKIPIRRSKEFELKSRFKL